MHVWIFWAGNRWTRAEEEEDSEGGREMARKERIRTFNVSTDEEDGFDDIFFRIEEVARHAGERKGRFLG